jgi:hypothetical protein
MKRVDKYPGLEVLMRWGEIAPLKILCRYSKNSLFKIILEIISTFPLKPALLVNELLIQMFFLQYLGIYTQ